MLQRCRFAARALPLKIFLGLVICLMAVAALLELFKGQAPAAACRPGIARAPAHVDLTTARLQGLPGVRVQAGVPGIAACARVVPGGRDRSQPRARGLAAGQLPAEPCDRLGGRLGGRKVCFL